MEIKEDTLIIIWGYVGSILLMLIGLKEGWW